MVDVLLTTMIHRVIEVTSGQLTRKNYYYHDRRIICHTNHPALLRMLELETLRQLGANANARIYIGFDKHAQPRKEEQGD